MYTRVIVYAIVAVMLTSTAVVAQPRKHHTNGHTNGQTREQYCRQLVGPEKGKVRLEKPPLCDRRQCDGMIA